MNELQRLNKRSSFDTVKDICKSAAALILLVLTVLLLLTEKAPDRFSSAFVRVVSATDGESLFKAFLGFIGSEEICTHNGKEYSKENIYNAFCCTAYPSEIKTATTIF